MVAVGSDVDSVRGKNGLEATPDLAASEVDPGLLALVVLPDFGPELVALLAEAAG